MTTGEKLAACRREKHLTQEQLAEALQVTRQSVSRWEMDVAFPETEKLMKLSRLFGCSIDYLLMEETIPFQRKARDVDEAFHFIRSCGCFFLATVAEGKPHLRPMGFIALWQGKLLLSTDRRKNVYRELQQAPDAALAAYHMDSRKWLRIQVAKEGCPFRRKGAGMKSLLGDVGAKPPNRPSTPFANPLPFHCRKRNFMVKWEKIGA